MLRKSVSQQSVDQSVNRSVDRSVDQTQTVAYTDVAILPANLTDIRKQSASYLWVSRFYDFQKFLRRSRGHNSDVCGYRQCGRHNSHCCLSKTALSPPRTPHTTIATSCRTYFQFHALYLGRTAQPRCFIFSSCSPPCITNRARYRAEQKRITVNATKISFYLACK
jgi:hypothetical protein